MNSEKQEKDGKISIMLTDQFLLPTHTNSSPSLTFAS